MKTERFAEYNADKSLTLPTENRNSLWQKNGNILIVDDNRGVLTALQLLLKPYFEGIITLPSPVTLPSVLREKSWQVVLLDMNFTSGINTGNEGLYWLHEIKKQCPALPVVLFTAYADIDLAVRGIKEGATDFVVKPWNNRKLVETLLNAVSASETKSPANGPNAGTYGRKQPPACGYPQHVLGKQPRHATASSFGGKSGLYRCQYSYYRRERYR